MKKALDRTFDLSEDGLAARYRVRLFVPSEDGEEAERVLLTSWELDQPGEPLDAWQERMADAAFDLLGQLGDTLTLIEFYPERTYRMGENTATFGEELAMARIRPQPDGTLALLDFGEMDRAALETRIGESLTAGKETAP